MPNRTTPVDGQPWPFADFIRDSPLWAPSGVVGQQASAYNVGDLALSFDIVTGTSVTPKLSLGRGRSRGGRYERTVAPWSSGMSGTAPQDGSALYGLNTGSNPRRDRIVLRRDVGLQAVYPIILVGTPAASPVAVALTQVETGVWDAPLHSWTLPGSSSTAPTNITDERDWINPDGLGLVPKLVPWPAQGAWQVVSTYAKPAVYRTGDGLVHGSSAVQSTAGIASGATVAVLDVGYRPTARLPIQLPATTSSGQVRWDILPSGVVEQQGGLASGVVVFLDGLTFNTSTLAAT